VCGYTRVAIMSKYVLKDIALRFAQGSAHVSTFFRKSGTRGRSGSGPRKSAMSRGGEIHLLATYLL